LPAGIAIGLSPRLSRLWQPVVADRGVVSRADAVSHRHRRACAAGAVAWLGEHRTHALGDQWYILFNVIAGAMAISTDLQEARAQLPAEGWRPVPDGLPAGCFFPIS